MSPILYVRPHARVFITSAAAARRVIHRTASLIQQADYVSEQLARSPIYDNAPCPPFPPAPLPALTACFYSAPSLAVVVYCVCLVGDAADKVKTGGWCPAAGVRSAILQPQSGDFSPLYKCKQHVR